MRQGVDFLGGLRTQCAGPFLTIGRTNKVVGAGSDTPERAIGDTDLPGAGALPRAGEVVLGQGYHIARGSRCGAGTPPRCPDSGMYRFT